MKEIKKDFLKLNKEERDFVKNANNLVINKDNKVIASKGLENGWISITENNTYSHTQKFIELKQENVSKILNINALETRVRNELTSVEDAIFELETFEQRIKLAKMNILNINKDVKSCNHVFAPHQAYFSFNLFHDSIYTWKSKCSYCGKESFENTYREEDRPEGFENLKVENHSNLI